jgi:hypothetical protein
VPSPEKLNSIFNYLTTFPDTRMTQSIKDIGPSQLSFISLIQKTPVFKTANCLHSLLHPIHVSSSLPIAELSSPFKHTLVSGLLQLISYEVPSNAFHHNDGDLLLVLLSIGQSWGIHLHGTPFLFIA